jgi:pimeloyl-ACP methyl ester carboxylesterase
VAVLLVALLLIGSSVGYNAATDGRATAPTGLRFVPAGDVSTRYRQWGTAGPTVVLIPGAFETADSFAALGATLGADHRAYALDLTGVGYSEAKAPYTIDHYAAQVLGFVAAMHLTGPDAPVLVGHSSGAAVAGLAVLAGHTAVAGLMFLDGDAAPLPVPPLLPALLIDPFRTTALRLAIRSDTVVRDVYRSQCGPTCPDLDAAGVDVWRRPLQQPGFEDALGQTLRHGRIPSLTGDQLDRLRATQIGKLVVFGVDDDQYDKAVPALIADQIGAPPPVLVPGRHLTMISSPDEVGDAIRRLSRR